MGYRYECTDSAKHETKKIRTYMSTDGKIIRQLPEYLQSQFPAYLTAKSGLSKTVGDLYRLCIQNSVGPKRFQKILRVLHQLKHSRLELQYLQAAISRKSDPTLKKVFTNSKTHQRKDKIVPFSKFDDRSKYAGHFPSAQYLRLFYTAYIAEIRHLIDKQMQVLDGIYLKGDHTFKIIKLISKVNGAPIFAALYTVCNEYEEVRLQFLVPTKALSHLRYAFEAMWNVYELYGYEHPQIFFTDNVQGDQSFLIKVMPSLLINVNQVTEKEPRPILNTRSYPLLEIPKDDVMVKCIRGFEEIELEIKKTFLDKRTPQILEDGRTVYEPMVIGFDCEWPFSRRDGPGKIATIQVADHEAILVCCVSGLQELPPFMISLLADENIMKVGRNVGGDLAKVERDFKTGCKGGRELGELCRRKGVISDGRISLAQICEAVLEHTLLKEEEVRLGAWSASQLSQEQINYAALDAWASLKIYEEVKAYGTIGKRLSSDEIAGRVLPQEKR